MLLHHVFDATLASHPDEIAIDVPDGPSLSYRDVDEASRRLAASLRLAPDDIVALDLPRCDERVYVAMLAVLRAGGAWTSLDARWPRERSQAVLDDARPVRVLDATGYEEGFTQAECEPASDDHDRNLAYVIYTSGTTGKPKGVMIEHRSVVNLAQADRAYFGLGPGDRVAQCSSTAYDSSVEEIWLAWASGAALVPLDDDTLRSGPDLGVWLAKERITVLGPPPTLLRMGLCEDPARDLPDLRLLYVGGEALPDDVVEAWGPGRWLENGYGPTEACVVALRARIRPGEAVTIGTAIDGMVAVVLDGVRTAADGEEGELCLGGVGLARGYLGDPALTAARFIEHPDHGRLYRTGDLVVRRTDGAHVFLGRIDTQVKLRGHRVELTDIEAHLCQLPGVRDAGVLVRDQVLYAVVAGTGLEPDALRADLVERVPSHYVPARIHVAEGIPRQATSSKIDRKALAALVPRRSVRTSGRCWSGPVGEPATDAVGEAVRATLGLGEVDLDADFFLDLGGDSVRAAQLVSALRRDPGFASVSVRDLYQLRKPAALAAELWAPSPARSAPVVRPTLVRSPSWFTAAQALVLLLGVHTGAVVLWFVGFVVLPWLLAQVELLVLVFAVPVALVSLGPPTATVSVLLAAVAKWILIGRYTKGRHPVWGWWHFRHWLMSGVAGLTPWAWLQGTVFFNGMLRVLGARVGARVHIDRGVTGLGTGWDLLDLGDDVAVGRDAALRTVDLDRAHIVLGDVRVGTGASLDTRSGLGPDASLGADAHLAPLSVISPGGQVSDATLAAGVPASRVGVAAADPDTEAPRRWAQRPLEPVIHGALTLVARAALALFMTLPYWAGLAAAILAFDLESADVLRWLYAPHPLDAPVLAALAAAVVAAGPLSLIWSALVCRALPRIRPGRVGRWSPAWILVDAKIGFVEASGRILSGTVYWPMWLRLAGMGVGRRCEVSTISGVIPELCTLDDEVFFADGIYLGAPRVRRGVADVAPVHLGRDTFVGNHSVLAPGTDLAGDVLLGVCTVADGAVMKRGTSWFGNPAFALPKREVVEVDRRYTHEPGPLQVLSRVFWESLRFALPLWPLAAVLAWFKMLGLAEVAVSTTVFFALVVPGWAVGTALLSLVWVWALKWTLLGRVKPGQHGLWSCWASRWDFVYVVWQRWAAPVLAALDGSLLIVPWLRAMGVRVGKNCVLGRGFAQVVDPDMLHLHDGATVACDFQAHSFEDRVLKMAHVHIGEHATVGAGAVVMYGARVAPDAHVGHHSVVMKDEEISGSVIGAPTRPA